MYSVVLLTALSAGSASPAWICNGCWGGGCYGCCGGCYGCAGCDGGCACSGGYGCTGCAGCHGCVGGHGGHHFLQRLVGRWGHGGCHGCYGPQGCWGGFHAGCAGCYGGGYGDGYPGGYVVPGAPAAPATTTPAPSGTTPGKMSPAGEPGATPGTTKGTTTTTGTPKPARLIVQVPEGAKLYVDDQPMASASARRTFRTPDLQPGETYYYIVRAELVRDGKTYNQTRQILLRAGDEIKASFSDLDKMIGATAQVDHRELR